MMVSRNVLQLIAVVMLVARVALGGQVDPATVVVAGSSLEAPPPYWEDSVWGITQSIDRAFPFDVLPLGPYQVTELQVPVYHYAGLAGSSADFSIHLDDAGAPGTQIALFQISGISTTQTVLSTSLPVSLLLSSDQRYWIVGSTFSGQVNWNLGDGVFGEAAFRVNGEAWQFNDNTNVSGFALLGSPVPEPSSLLLLGVSGLMLYRRHRKI